jgi:hypothetical protein
MIDPLQGALDAAERRLRPVHSNSCAMEPVRWLRAGRLLGTCSLKPDPSLQSAAARGRRPLLHGVAAETRRLELWAVLACPHRADGLRWMDDTGLLTEMVPAWGELAARRDADLGGRAADGFSLEAVEALHLERWAALLEPPVLEGISRRLDRPAFPSAPHPEAHVPGGGAPPGGWALTAMVLWLHRLAPLADVSADLATLALHGLGASMDEARAVSRLVLARLWLDRPVPLGRSGLEPHAAVADLCLREALCGPDSPELRAAASAANSVLPGFLAEGA